MGTASMAGELKDRRGFVREAASSTEGRSAGTECERKGTIRGEHNWSMGQRTEWDLYSWSVPQPKMCAHWYRWGLGSKHGFGNISGKGTAVSCEETALSQDRSKETHNPECLWSKPDSTDAKRHCCDVQGPHLVACHHALASAPIANRETSSGLTFTCPWPLAKAPHSSLGWLSLWMQLQTSPSTCPHPQPQWLASHPPHSYLLNSRHSCNHSHHHFCTPFLLGQTLVICGTLRADPCGAETTAKLQRPCN